MYDPNHIITPEDLKKLPSEDDWNKIRYAASTNLYYLANNVLRNPKAKPLLPKVHGGICDTLVHKDPNIPLEEWSPVKERVILSFRGSLKSTIEAADVVQIILCAPNVRIVLLSGKIGLAKSILRLARSYFESNEVLMMLFPQFCSDINQNSESFTTPARTDHSLRDPTIQVATFGSVKAGVHAEYLKLDDCTNEINQATPELVEKSIQKYDDLDPLLEPGGYIDFTGTRWAVDDLPEYIKTKGDEMEEETGRKHVLYFFQPVWNVKKIADEHPEWTDAQIQIAQRARDEREKKHRLNVDDVNLAWPEKLTPEFLWPKYRKNPRDFACQYLLNPDSTTHGVFTQKLLARQTRSIDQMPMPHQSQIFINWDLAGVSGTGDFAVGIVGIWEFTGRLFIVDAVLEKFTSSTAICNAIIRLFKKWNPDYHRIESANGAELLQGELAMIAKKADLERAFYPNFEPPSNEANAKVTRISMLAGALEKDQIQFYLGIECLEDIFKQFEKFGGKPSSKYHDDAPDCIAQLYQRFKDEIGPKSIGYITPSDVVVDFQSEGPNIHDGEKDVDPHQDERLYADVEFLQRFTTSFPER